MYIPRNTFPNLVWLEEELKIKLDDKSWKQCLDFVMEQRVDTDLDNDNSVFRKTKTKSKSSCVMLP